MLCIYVTCFADKPLGITKPVMKTLAQVYWRLLYTHIWYTATATLSFYPVVGAKESYTAQVMHRSLQGLKNHTRVSDHLHLSQNDRTEMLLKVSRHSPFHLLPTISSMFFPGHFSPCFFLVWWKALIKIYIYDIYKIIYTHISICVFIYLMSSTTPNHLRSSPIFMKLIWI